MGVFLGVLGLMALAALLLLGLWLWLDARRTVRRLDRMLSTAIDGGFGEESFDESAPSALESRMARFLNGSARSLRGVQRQRESIQRLLSDISHQTKTPLANLRLYSSLLMEEELAKSLGLPVLARVVATATTGVSPDLMGIGPISATQKTLEKAGLTVADIDLFEINEAFAAQCVACQRTLGIDEDKLNVNGGGISLGHPVGATGSRLVVTLLHELKRRGGRYGLATLCAGGGMGTAVLIEMA